MTRPVVLFIDDQPSARQLFMRLLDPQRFEPVVADGVTAAESFIAKRMPDLVITDLRMPGVDGMTGMERYLAIDPELPVVVCSGYGSTAIDEQVGRDSVTRFLEKPFRMHDLLAALRSVLRESGSRRE